MIDGALSTRTGIGEYIYDYSPQVNDPVGTYRIVFKGIVSGILQSHQNFFEVIARKSPLIIDAEEFRDSSFGKRLDLSEWTNQEIENAILDAQASVEGYIGYKVFSHVKTGERHQVNVNKYGILSLRLNDKPIVKLLRVILRYDPTSVLYELPIAGFDIDHEASMIHYNAAAGFPIPGTIDTVARYTAFAPWYDLIIDYEAGLHEPDADLQLAVKILTMSIISGELAGLSSSKVKKVKSGNYEETFFDVNSTNSTGGDSTAEQRAYSLLRKAGYVQPGIV